MGRLANRMIMLTALMALGGCALEPGTAEDEAAAQEEALFYPRPYSQPPVLTLYSEAGLWGTSLRVATAPVGRAEQQRLIPRTEIEAAGLLGRVSSLRLACGTRDARVVLFPDYNEGTTLWTWSPFANGHIVDCLAGQTVNVELHSAVPALADRVSSIYFVAHTTDASELSLSWLVTSAIRAALADDPTEGASPRGNARLTLRGDRTFDIRQDFELDSAACGARPGHFVLRAQLTGSTWTVSFVSRYVDPGLGDRWGCRSGMESALESGARGAAVDIAAGLNDLMPLAGSHPRHYLVPNESLRDFMLMSGGDEWVLERSL